MHLKDFPRSGTNIRQRLARWPSLQIKIIPLSSILSNNPILPLRSYISSSTRLKATQYPLTFQSLIVFHREVTCRPTYLIYIYISDILKTANTTIATYADDTVILAPNSDSVQASTYPKSPQLNKHLSNQVENFNTSR